MLKESVHLSDWIQYFISIKILSFTIIGMLSSGIIALSILLVNFSSGLTFESYIVLNFINYSFAIIALWLTFAKKSPLVRATKLFNKIMKNPNEIEVNEIRKEWYGGINMKSSGEKTLSRWFLFTLFSIFLLCNLAIVGYIFSIINAEFLMLFQAVQIILVSLIINFLPNLHKIEQSIYQGRLRNILLIVTITILLFVSLVIYVLIPH